MSKKSTLIVLDFDDTLILSAFTLIPFYRGILDKQGFGLATEQVWRAHWGKILEEVISACCPNLDESQIEQACLHIRQNAENFKVPSVIGGPPAIELLEQ